MPNLNNLWHLFIGISFLPFVFNQQISPIPSQNNTLATPSYQPNLPSLCTVYPSTGICNKYIDYSIYTNGTSISVIEQQLGYLTNLSSAFGKVAPSCVDAYFRYSCSFAYPKCDNNELRTGCLSTCDEVHFACKNIFLFTGKSFLPDCQQKNLGLRIPPSSNSTCNAIPPKIAKLDSFYNLSAVPPQFVASQCPSPFIKDAQTIHSSNSFCFAGCCMPCPSQNYFYTEGSTQRGFLATNILRFISAVLSFFMMISYLVLPDKRRHPSLLILNFSISLFLFNLVSFFTIANPESIQCANSITPSTQDNNIPCAVQGAILIFGSLATCCWSAALILNLHLHTVWRSSFFMERYLLLNVVCYGYPTIVMAVNLGLHKVRFEFANLCLVSVDAIFELFFYPLVAVILPAFLLHLSTFVYIARMAFQESTRSETRASRQSSTEGENTNVLRAHKHVITAVKIQWRALLLVFLAIVSVVFYWIFYFTQINKLKQLEKDHQTVLHWIECMVSPAGNQNVCSNLLKDHLPPLPLMITAETLVSSLGIWLAIIFGRSSLFREWGDLFYDIQQYLKTKKTTKDQFIEL
ncbi:hypothetical protein BY458DRAFT_554092 [Sporodiniella umbellata]|nr:hypothetical protein BY458DRAFT_554092 [Sporodiniella umbellata]